jgi:type I restriction enzyme R subunit
MSGEDGEQHFGKYERDFFDLVIIDECHRGGANDESTWRGILDYFSSAVHLGLTATPKRTDNADTTTTLASQFSPTVLRKAFKMAFSLPLRLNAYRQPLMSMFTHQMTK